MNTKIFKEMNLKVSFSSGLVNKNDFVPPCILLETIKRPKLRFKNQKNFLKEFLKKINKKIFKDMTNTEYCKYLDQSIMHGETKEYLKWRKNNQKKILTIEKLIVDFNKNQSNQKREVTLVLFEDGSIRIETGSQSIPIFKQREKMQLGSKKLLMKEMTDELELFVNFIKQNI